MPLKFALLSGAENGSPRVLAETLNNFIQSTGNQSTIYFKTKALRRLNSATDVKENKLLWLIFKLLHFANDLFLYRKLRKSDAVIICACTPYGFYKNSFNIVRLKSSINNRPVLYYAVQYLGNSPTIMQKLLEGGHASIERYDWHLTVSDVTELRGIPSPPWNQLGLYLKSAGLKPEAKKEFIALIDFAQPGFEDFRKQQIQVLEELNIPYISLEGRYPINVIRELYKRSALYFMQSREAFGMPIAECLAMGSYIVTPDTSWPMSWRLDEKPEIHGPGKLPECFIVYNDSNSLKKQLTEIQTNYNLSETPKKIFDIFYKSYPTFYEGNLESLNDIIKRIESSKLSHSNLT